MSNKTNNVYLILERLISCQSITPNDDGCQSLISDFLEGFGFEINIIDEINDRDYKETLCEIVSPKLLKGYKGTHHLSSIDTFSVTDVKKFSNKY